MHRLPRVAVCLLLCCFFAPVSAGQPDAADVQEARADEPMVVAVVGAGLVERLGYSGQLAAAAVCAFPDRAVTVRHLGWAGDTPTLRPRETNVPTIQANLADLRPGLILLCYGSNEAWDGTGTEGLLDTASAYAERAGGAEVVIVSPIAQQDVGLLGPQGDALAAVNDRLAEQTRAMRAAAEGAGLRFVDLFTPTLGHDGPALTDNGVGPNAYGCWVVAAAVAEQLEWVAGERTDAGTLGRLVELCVDTDAHWQLVFRPTNSEYVFGRRHEPYGSVNFPPELEKWRGMTATRDAAIHALDKPSLADFLAAPPTVQPNWPPVANSGAFESDAWVPLEVVAEGRENSVGDLIIKPADEFVDALTPAEGYVVECFASEEDFPELANPLAMTWDHRHRLWVLVTPTYPHLLPGDQPQDKLLILEDTDGDGRADTCTVFVDNLYCPMGFQVDVDGSVYVGQAPHLVRLTDTDGDDVADRSEVLLTGFGMPDSHHQMSAFEWDPNGGFIFAEGVFTRSAVETPYGPRRIRDAAVWRYDPRTGRLETLSHCGYANPWGHAFDDYGDSILSDASGGAHFDFAQVITAFDFPRKPNRIDHFLRRGRPIAGNEMLTGRHFPDDVQGSYVCNQSIGFHGTRWDQLIPTGSGHTHEPLPDLLTSSDTNFRPVACEVGPDGALYIADWSNPLIGHMQYSVRDPRRDHTHGRIWRVRHATRDLVTPPDLVNATPNDLLELLKLQERNTRQHARRLLQRGEPRLVFPAAEAWFSRQSPSDERYDRYRLEMLWLHQAHGRVDLGLLREVMSCATPQARAGGTRALRHWLQAGAVEPGDALRLLEPRVQDADMAVRLEAVTACGFVPVADASAIASLAAEQEMDDGLRIVLEETLGYLAKYGESDSDIARRFRLERMSAAELLAAELDELTARVTLARADLPLSRREAALAVVAEAEGGDPVAALLAAASSPRSAAAATDLLARQPSAALSAQADAFAGLLGEASEDVRVAGAVALLRGGRPVGEVTPRAAAAAALAGWGDGAMVDAALPTLEQWAGEADAASPAMLDVFDAVSRADAERPEAFGTLRGYVDAALTAPMSDWGPVHLKGMAALRSMHRVPADAWPDGFADLQQEAIDRDRLVRGAAVFHHPELGCARCHGDDGRGAEGFPGLSGSAKLLGDPVRAASIVVHGLQGELTTADGRTIDSTMSPLGALMDDRQVADALTYARRAFGNFASEVQTYHVAAARVKAPAEGGMWPVSELTEAFPFEGETLGVTPTAAAAAAAGGGGGSGLGFTVFVVLLLIGLGLGVIAAAVWLWPTG